MNRIYKSIKNLSRPPEGTRDEDERKMFEGLEMFEGFEMLKGLKELKMLNG